MSKNLVDCIKKNEAIFTLICVGMYGLFPVEAACMQILFVCECIWLLNAFVAYENG